MDARDIAVTLTSNVRNDGRAKLILVENPRSSNPIVTPIADLEKENHEKEGGTRFDIAPRQPITGQIGGTRLMVRSAGVL